MTDQSKPSFNANAARKADVLPRWNFDAFYPDIKSDELEADKAKAAAMVKEFAADYEGKIAQLSGQELANAINKSKQIGDLFGKMGTYIQLRTVQDNTLGGELVKFGTWATEVTTATNFFGNEIKKLDEQSLKAMIAQTPDLQALEPWIDSVRRGIPHTAHEEVQKYSAQLSPEDGWNKLFDDLHTSLVYEFDGEELGLEEILDIVAGDPDPARREAAHEVFVEVMNKNSLIWAQVHNELMRLKTVDDRWTNFENPWDARHFSNNIKPEVVDALETAVKDSYESIPHRFYKLKAALMGQDTLKPSDRNVNVFEDKQKRYIPFSEARDIVLDAYAEFSPEMAAKAKEFFDKGWIDAPVEKKKQGGAFAHPGGAALAHAMVMLNYQGTPRDVATMAHELGHGVHQELAKHKGDAVVSTPLTLAETASVFGEMLTFKSLLRNAADDDERRKLLFEKVNDMINTVYRQMSFYDFEKKIHGHYKANGPLTEEEFAGYWLEALGDSYGDAIPLDKDYGAVYGYIPHLVHTPFYVYAYTFGDTLVNALYTVYEEGSVPDFEEKYIKMLEMGGTLKPEDLKEMFGLDIEDPSFWNKGLKVIEDLLDELEGLCEPLLEANQNATPKPKAP